MRATDIPASMSCSPRRVRVRPRRSPGRSIPTPAGPGTSGAGGTGPAILRAYDATNVVKALWSSSTLSTDKCGNAVKFVVPTVANGKVYVVGTNQLTVYGLLP